MMQPDDRPPWMTLRIQCRVIEHVFGKGNFDDAGDELVYALRLVSAEPDQYRYRFDFDTSLGSHHFHEMLFEVEGIPDPVWDRFLERVAALGLVEAGPSIQRTDQVTPSTGPLRAVKRRRKS